MPKGNYYIPEPNNEPVFSYAPGTSERDKLIETLAKLKKEEQDIPMYIGGEEVRTGKKIKMSPPHEHKHTLGYFHEGDKTHVKKAIESAKSAKREWAALSWEHRASIFFKSSRFDCRSLPCTNECCNDACPVKESIPI